MEKLLIGIGDLHSHLPAINDLLTGLDKQYSIFESEGVLRQDIELVFTGDYIDRGDDGVKVIEKVMKLEKSNKNCTALIGNHELSALAALDDVKTIIRGNSSDPLFIYRCSTIHGRNGGVKLIEALDNNPKRALEKFYEEFSRNGNIGSWLRTIPPFVIKKIGEKSVLFMHAGLPYNIKNKKSIEQYYKQYEQHINGASTYISDQKYLKDSIVMDEGLFWIREEFFGKSKQELDDLAQNLNVDFFVVGHTVHRTWIANYSNRVFCIDTGMSPSYKGSLHAIVFKEKGIYDWNGLSNQEKVLLKH